MFCCTEKISGCRSCIVETYGSHILYHLSYHLEFNQKFEACASPPTVPQPGTLRHLERAACKNSAAAGALKRRCVFDLRPFGPFLHSAFAWSEMISWLSKSPRYARWWTRRNKSKQPPRWGSDGPRQHCSSFQSE